MFLNYGVGGDSWESLGQKEIKPVNLKGNQPWIFIGSTDAEALILWPIDGKGWPTGKDPDAKKDWGQGRKGATEDETFGLHQLKEHEFEQTPGDSEGQGSLAYCSSWGGKESDMIDETELTQTCCSCLWLNSNNNPAWLVLVEKWGSLNTDTHRGKIRWRHRENNTIPKPKRDVGTDYQSWLSEEIHPAHTLISDLKFQAPGTGHPHRSTASSHSVCVVFS